MQRIDIPDKEDAQEYLDPAVSDEDIDDYDFQNYDTNDEKDEFDVEVRNEE